MITIGLAEVARLRELTGVGIVAAKRALEEANGDVDKAIAALRKAGQKVAAGKSARATREGVIGHYVHDNGKVAALVVVACETDFVARSETFQSLVHDLALQVAAMNPIYLKPEDVTGEVLTREREILAEQTSVKRKPKKVIDQIIQGKLEKYFEETCLLRQRWVKDDSLTVSDLITAAVQKLGENIQIREFARLCL